MSSYVRFGKRPFHNAVIRHGNPQARGRFLGYSSANRFLLRHGRANPSFCRDEMEDKANPEGDAEKFMGRQA